MKAIAYSILVLIILTSFQDLSNLKGTWEFKGGIYNGKKEGAPDGYKLQRKYGLGRYDAFMLEKGQKPYNYEKGNYRLNRDTCIETETFSSEPSKLTGIPIHYLYTIRHDSLILTGTLPTGMHVEEYWKRIRQ